MSILTSTPRYLRLEQKVVYWAPAGSDSFGRLLVGAPVEFDARWEDGWL